MQGLKIKGASYALAAALLPLLATTGPLSATEVSESADAPGAGCRAFDLGCAADRVAVLDPPEDITYTTRAPVSTPRASASSEQAPAETNAARRATIDVPGHREDAPAETGQDQN